jgi:predicted DNA-binding transcriptional regulator YafY
VPAARTSADDVVRVLRASVRADNAPLATVHQLPVAPPADARFDHLPVDERLLLTRALDDGRPVEIDYVDSAHRRTTRVVEDLQDLGGLLEGWCRLRDDERNFSPEGIVAVRPVG